MDMEAQLNQGVAVDKNISLYDYYIHWVATYKEPKVSDVSMVLYNTTAKNIREFFGNANIKDIPRSQYQSFINTFGRNHAPSTVQKVNGFIRACVQSAILDDFLIKDFTQGVELVANEDKVIKVQYLNLKEIKSLLEAAKDHLSPNFTSRYMIITAIYTGMRLSEIQALTWNDIDWFNQTININKSWNAVIHQFKNTKNKSSVRKIKINPELLTILQQLKAHSKGTMVFLNQYGTIPTSGAVNRTLRSLLADLNITKINFHFHSLRHSHVALLLANGIDIYAISKRLGHSNIKTTANTYAYLIDEYKDKTDQQIITALSSL
ncbi:bacteriophage integrase [Limosilactobacillus coleohominis DSM 14060]|nr:bacteriophage integrase [Limosilactobacillus coleohominis DSM 14060]